MDVLDDNPPVGPQEPKATLSAQCNSQIETPEQSADLPENARAKIAKILADMAPFVSATDAVITYILRVGIDRPIGDAEALAAADRSCELSNIPPKQFRSFLLYILEYATGQNSQLRQSLDKVGRAARVRK